ncbi:hypothetical protein CKAN_01102400 [Cinnamomum micranthum f. kanehirae]|uniref:Uncharacterized protein n=1 Tax=Cinnamomum micranthum f. kanehirae TaxID=337451 RepID=A0A3S3MTW3_9MAGN|nr:hypothetical protein CKAN_01102400 [Cinnamomum micranthum f. kanehirae]
MFTAVNWPPFAVVNSFHERYLTGEDLNEWYCFNEIELNEWKMWLTYKVGFWCFPSPFSDPLLPPSTFPLKISSPTATSGGGGVQTNFLFHLSISSLFPYSLFSLLFLPPPKTGKRKVLTPAARDSYQITLSTVRMHTTFLDRGRKRGIGRKGREGKMERTRQERLKEEEDREGEKEDARNQLYKIIVARIKPFRRAFLGF